MTWGDDVLTVLMGTLPEDDLLRHMQSARRAGGDEDRPQPAKVRRRSSARAGWTTRWLVERGTMPGQRVMRLAETDVGECPYFAIILVPRPGPPAGAGGMTGSLVVAGLGPGDSALVTPEVDRGAGWPRPTSSAIFPMSRA